jgi:dihydroxy-acid dehydratase
LKVSAAEMARRIKSWKAPAPKISRGYLKRYARQVSSAGRGAVLDTVFMKEKGDEK